MSRHRRTAGRAGLATIVTALVAACIAPIAAAQVQADFDGDGYEDLAVGAPGDSVRGEGSAGAVNVLYGSRGGLREARDEQFTKARPGLGVVSAGARFGAGLATGDIDDDGYADLAVGAPGEGVPGQPATSAGGVVTVLYGSPGGLRARPAVGTWTQDSPGVPGIAEIGDGFGETLAMGDFDGDGRADLAVGVPGEAVAAQANAGAVNVLYGRGDGLGAAGSDLWTQATPGMEGLAGHDHRFGAALAAGDLSANGRDDLAIGIPGAAISGHVRAGAVSVLYGRTGGLSAVDDLWSQDARGIKGVAADDDRFGAAVAIGDFDDDGAGDLAVGVPTETVDGAFGAGAVNVLFGSRTGVRARGDQLWTQGSPGVRTLASIGETFGASLASADFSGDGADDLAIGVPGESVGELTGGGAVAVLIGSGGEGLQAGDDQLWTQDVAGVPGRAERGDRFGTALSTGDFDGDGIAELVVGTPNDSVHGVAGAGAVNVLRGSRSGLRSDGRGLWTQGTAGVRGAVGMDRFGESLAGRR